MNADDRLAPIKQRASDLIDAWAALRSKVDSTKALDGNRFDTTLSIPNLNISIDELDIQVNVIAGEVEKLPEATSNALALAPPMACRRFEEALQKSLDSISGLSQTMENGLASLNAETFQGARPRPHPSDPQRTKPVDVGDAFVSIARPLDDAFVRLIQIKQALPSSNGDITFPGLVKSLRKVVEEAASARDEVGGIHKQALEALENVKAGFKQVEKLKAHIETLSEEAQSARKASKTAQSNAEESASSAASAHKAVQSTLKEASELDAKVKKYQSEFKAFQDALDDREKRLKDGDTEHSRLIEALKEIESEIAEKNDKASAMLQHATVAGLAASFGITRTNLNKELKFARFAFYSSVVVLVLLAIPMLLYMLPGVTLGGPVVDRNNAPASAVFADVLARIAILLPGIWFAGFAAKRHSALFRLREHYEYKYNMAVSVEGFKQQAEEIGHAIAGATFYELLTRNPADVMDGGKHADTEKPPNPLIERVVKWMEGRGKKTE